MWFWFEIIDKTQWHISHINGRPFKVIAPGRHYFGRGAILKVDDPTRLLDLWPRVADSVPPPGLIYQDIRANQFALVSQKSREPEYRRTSFWYLALPSVEVRVFDCDSSDFPPKAEEEKPFIAGAATPAADPSKFAAKLVRLPQDRFFGIDEKTLVVLDFEGEAETRVERIDTDGKLNCEGQMLVKILAASGAAKYICWTVVENEERATLRMNGGAGVDLSPGLHAWLRLDGRCALERKKAVEKEAASAPDPCGGAPSAPASQDLPAAGGAAVAPTLEKASRQHGESDPAKVEL